MAKGAIQLHESDLKRQIEIIRHDVAQADADAAGYRAQVDTLRELLKYDQPIDDPRWPGACELVVPYIQAARCALLAHYSPTLLGIDPMFTATGYEAAEEYSDDLERTNGLMLQETQYGVWAEQWFDLMLLGGPSAILTRWRRCRETRPAWEVRQSLALDPWSGDFLEMPGEMSVIELPQDVYDGPEYYLLDCKHFGSFPDITIAPEYSPGAYYRHYLTGWQLEQRAEERDAEGRPLYDAEQVKVVLKQGGSGSQESAVADQYGMTAGTGDGAPDHRWHVYTIIEAYWYYGTGEARRRWVFTYEEDTGVCLRARPQPEWHGQPPFVVAGAYQAGGSMAGESLITAGAGQTQLYQQTLLRLAIDAMAIGVMPEMLVAASLGEDIERLRGRRGPGAMIPFPDQYLDQPFAKPFSAGFNPNAVIPMLEYLDAFGQKASGAVDALKAVPSASNMTATQAEQILESAQKVLAWQTEHLGQAMERQMLQIHALLLQHVGNPFPQRWWREAHGQKGPPVSLPEALLAGRYRWTTNGVRATNNKRVLAERMLGAYQLIFEDPHVMNNPVRRHNLLMQTLAKGYDIRQPEMLLGTLEEWEQEDQQAALLAQQQMADQAAALEAQVGSLGPGAPAMMAGGAGG